MTLTVEHEHTAQEQQIWDHLEAGEHDEIEALEQTAKSEPHPEDLPAGEPSAAEQFDVDYQNAYAHYQDAHEAPEGEREQHTADTVEDENAGL